MGERNTVSGFTHFLTGEPRFVRTKRSYNPWSSCVTEASSRKNSRLTVWSRTTPCERVTAGLVRENHPLLWWRAGTAPFSAPTRDWLPKPARIGIRIFLCEVFLLWELRFPISLKFQFLRNSPVSPHSEIAEPRWLSVLSPYYPRDTAFDRRHPLRLISGDGKWWGKTTDFWGTGMLTFVTGLNGRLN